MTYAGNIVYYYWGENDVSLYVGRSEPPGGWFDRLKAHIKEKSGLRYETRRIKIVQCETAAEMVALERADIARLQPRYNKDGNPAYYQRSLDSIDDAISESCESRREAELRARREYEKSNAERKAQRARREKADAGAADAAEARRIIEAAEKAHEADDFSGGGDKGWSARAERERRYAERKRGSPYVNVGGKTYLNVKGKAFRPLTARELEYNGTSAVVVTQVADPFGRKAELDKSLEAAYAPSPTHWFDRTRINRGPNAA